MNRSYELDHAAYVVAIVIANKMAGRVHLDGQIDRSIAQSDFLRDVLETQKRLQAMYDKYSSGGLVSLARWNAEFEEYMKLYDHAKEQVKEGMPLIRPGHALLLEADTELTDRQHHNGAV